MHEQGNTCVSGLLISLITAPTGETKDSDQLFLSKKDHFSIVIEQLQG